MRRKRPILALDPSSTITGYSVMAHGGRLVEHGIIKPNKPSADSYIRIQSIIRYVWEILDIHSPDKILIEWTLGKVGQRRHQGRGAGLSVYGAAVGSIATQCETWASINGSAVVPVDENKWTRGVDKRDRALAIAHQFPSYRPGDDPGMDAADAIGLAVWYLQECKVM